MDKIVKLILCLTLSAASCARPQQDDRTCPAKLFPQQGSLIGKKIPGLTLDGFQNGVIKKFPLASFRGKWLILFFYPADFTFVCPTELKELADYYPEFKATGAQIVSISTDSAFVHQAWHASNESVKKVAYPMLSDRSGALSRALGVYVEDEGTCNRASFLVNPEGAVMAYEIHHDAIGRNADELLRKLQAAVAVKGGHGGMCPAGWKPGAPLIKSE